MYDTSPESWALGAVYRLFFIPIALIYCEYKAKKQSAFGAELSREVKLAVISHNFSASRKMFNILPQMHLYIEPLNGSIDVTSFFRRMQYTTQKIAFLF